MEIKKGVHLHIIKTNKFKDIGISIRCMAPLKEETATQRSLLALMLCDRCLQYDTKKKMSDHQDFLYGATLHAQTIGYGKAQVLDIRSKIVDPCYIDQKTNLFEDMLAFLKEIIFHPLLNEETLLESSAILKSKMLRMKDDPSQYAISKGLKLGGKGFPLAISALGEEEVLASLQLDDVIEAHRSLLLEDRIDICICGQLDELDLKTKLMQALPFHDRQIQVETHYAFQQEEKTEQIIEYRDITQSNIFMLWNTGVDICDDDYYTIRVGSAMFGQYPASLLFQEVREKHSLCYSIYANLISFDGALGVTTGVEKENVEEAISLIQKQFKRICENDFPDALMEVSKRMIINSLHATKDTMNSLMAQAYQNAILEQELSIDDRIRLIEKVTREDVCRVFNACRFQLSFIVSKEDDHAEDGE